MKTIDPSAKQLEAVRFIRNQLIQTGRAPSVRELQRGLGFKWPRSAALLIETLTKNGLVKRASNGELRVVNDPEEEKNNARTVEVPLVGFIACGAPLTAEENIEAMVPISRSFIQPGQRYFLLRAKGDSMDDAGIHDGECVLVKQQSTAQDGDIVVALIDDEATLKEFHRSGDAVVLKPHNKKYPPIILRRDFQVQGVVAAKGLQLQ